jgi:S-DNA-T family DNA segregation ATPase FtsK/SpoIIIE
MSIVLTLIRADRIFISTLPDEVTGKHWIADVDKAGMSRRLASVEASAGEWVIYSHASTTLVSPEGRKVSHAKLLSDAGLYHLQAPGEVYSALLVETPGEQDKTFKKLGFATDLDLTIGRKPDNLFELAGGIVSSHHALLRFVNGAFYVADLKSANGVFVNGKAIRKNCLLSLAVGDVVFIFGLKIAIGKRFVAYNNPGGRLRVHPHPSFVPYRPQVDPANSLPPFVKSREHYFYRSPRIMRGIEGKTFTIEEPPAPIVAEETPLLLRIGPSIGMAFTSVFMGLYMFTNLMSGSGSLLRMVPMLAMITVMILGAVLWPSLSARYTRKKNAEKEARRVESYSTYLDKIRSIISEEIALQKQVLTETRISVAECFKRAAAHDRRLFERGPTHNDFLSLRIGIGDVPLVATFRWPQEKISLDNDILKAEAIRLSQQPYGVRGVPLVLSLLNDYVSGVVGRRKTAYPFVRGLIAQIVALHAPDEVKLVVLCNEGERAQWEFMFALPHVFDDTSAVRYVATNAEEAAELSLRLERELNQRLEARVEMVADYGAYYLVLALDHDLASKTEVLGKLTALRENKGFAVLSYAKDIRDLPKECSRIIHVDTLQDRQGALYSQLFNPHDPAGIKTPFLPDIAVGVVDAGNFAAAIAGVELQTTSVMTGLPKSLGFLELFEAAKVEHLNVVSRWQDNNPCISLAAPIGMDANGTVSVLNIHEDFHGPHGLIAGMTGSGKSEFIIAYVLSLAVNYRPDEVSFVLIDYKGGGLAGAFDNERLRLPHLAGTVTNLDGAAITRSLVSIDSELRRRQDAFNRARDVSGSGTMDIYKYQELYRLGMVREPISHLLIISDEFAELKAQQPEFMEQLIKTARIGRSLGVHLILATQKPSGVVNDQIWSNARFKVCLKVAEAADSREMLKTDDAAELVDPGRYYLQIGYNEYYALGQGCYAGTKYRPTEHFVKQQDNSVTLISNTGRGIMSIKPEVKGVQSAAVPESVAVLEHLVQVGHDEQLAAATLWLDPIPEIITVDGLLEKYHPVVEPNPFVLNPVIGEYDDPTNQSQHLLTLPLSQEGNAIIYGSTGSGKATVVSSMLYAMLKVHTAYELNAYLLDFGAETLGVFKAAPQVGDVVFAGEDEKVENLIRMLFAELERRRKLLAETGGSFLAYTEQVCDQGYVQGLKSLPNIFVVINSFEVFIELYERHLDDLVTLSRDGIRCGITFLLTCSRSSGVSYRLLPNFKQRLALKLNNPDEYLNVIGSMSGVAIPHAYARGLIKFDKVYEFQGARISKDAPEQEAVRRFVAELGDCVGTAEQGIEQTSTNVLVKAPAIPSLPDCVEAKTLITMGAVVARSAVPIGISKEAISVANFDFARSPVMMVLSENEELETRFLRGLVEVLASQEALRITVLDPEWILSETSEVTSASNTASTTNITDTTDATVGAVRLLQSTDAVNGFVNGWARDGLSERDFVVLASLRGVMGSLEGSIRAAFETCLQDGNYRKMAGLVVSGEPSRFSSFSFELWFREITSYGNGLWLGDGVNSQTILKLSSIVPSASASLQEEFAWYINRGTPTLIKYVTAARDRREHDLEAFEIG